MRTQSAARPTARAPRKPSNAKTAAGDRFLQGIAVALAEICRQGEPGIAMSAMNAMGYTVRNLEAAGADSYDLKFLRLAAREYPNG